MLLIRENYGRYCETTFQHKILERSLYNDLNPFNNPREDEFEFLKSLPSLKQENEEDLLLIKLRWYMFDQMPQKYSSTNPLFKISELLIETIINNVFPILEYLKSLENPFDLIQEYCFFWKRFILSVFDLENIFRDYTIIVNSVYEEKFKKMPNFPKFSILRMMIKIWIKIIIENLNPKLLEAYGIMIQELRGYGNKIQLNFFGENYISQENYYQSNKEAMGSLLQSFLNSLMDCNVHELNIHLLGHSHMKFSENFECYGKKFNDISKEYYDDLSHRLKDFPSKFRETLKKDFELFQPIINPNMVQSLKRLQISTIIKNYQENIKKINQEMGEDKVEKTIKKEKILQLRTIMKDIPLVISQEKNLTKLYKNLKKKFGKSFVRDYMKYVF